jgi:uncharacterized membrane protein (UPF0136 family)
VQPSVGSEVEHELKIVVVIMWLVGPVSHLMLGADKRGRLVRSRLTVPSVITILHGLPFRYVWPALLLSF